MALNHVWVRLGRVLLGLAVGLSWLLVGCSLPQVSAESRIFAPVTLEFIDDYSLPPTIFQDAPIGGLSGLSYDVQKGLLYAISDDRSAFAPARFYTLKPKVDVSKSTGNLEIKTIDIKAATTLKQANGETYERNKIDAEGIALSPRGTVYISSEGAAKEGVPPFVNEYGLATGALIKALPIPAAYLPKTNEDGTKTGIQDNKGFEGLTMNVDASPELARLFVAIENPLEQDLPVVPTNPTPTAPPKNRIKAAVETAEKAAQSSAAETLAGSKVAVTPKEPVTPPPVTPPVAPAKPKLRIIHYALTASETDIANVVGEYAYELDPGPIGTVENGVSDILSIDAAGHFLSLERSLGITGFNGKIYQFSFAGAGDVQSFKNLRPPATVQPVQKQLLLDLNTLGITIDNVEGMALGAKLPDGSQSLWIVSDDNFNKDQVTQFLLFRLKSQDS
jgi:hypothetical protein